MTLRSTGGSLLHRLKSERALHVWLAPIAMSLLTAALVPAMNGCATTPEVRTNSDTSRVGSVYLVRGLMDVFSLGLNDLAKRFRSEGIHAEALSAAHISKLGMEIRRAKLEGRLEEPVVLVGHSYGADDAVRLAQILNDGGVAVDTIALIDPTTPPAVPSNVRRVFNLYKSSPGTDWVPVLRGVPVTSESPATEIVNYDIRTSPDADRYAWTNHFNLESNKAVQDVIHREVIKALPMRSSRLAAPLQAAPSQATHDRDPVVRSNNPSGGS